MRATTAVANYRDQRSEEELPTYIIIYHFWQVKRSYSSVHLSLPLQDCQQVFAHSEAHDTDWEVTEEQMLIANNSWSSLANEAIGKVLASHQLLGIHLR